MYLINLFKEIGDWITIARTSKKNSKLLLKSNLRTDYIGRIYTVINVPEELMKDTPSRENFVYEKLRAFDDILIKLKINELIYPTIELIPNTNSYLLVLQGNTEFIQFWKIIGHGILYTFYIIIAKIIIKIISKNTDFFTNALEFIKEYI